MPDANTTWTLGITVALALCGGFAFLAWNAPDFWDRLAVVGFCALVLTSVCFIAYTAGLEVGLNEAQRLTHGRGHVLLQKAADNSSPPAWIVWGIIIATWVGMALSAVASYRANSKRKGE